MDITKEQYLEALAQDGVLKESSTRLLNVMFDAPNCEATAPQLAQMLGYPDFPPVNALIGKLGKRIADALNIDVPADGSGRHHWWRLVADGEPRPDGYTWMLKGELFDALAELGLLDDQDPSLYPEVVTAKTDLFEGAVRQVTINAYERNTVAVELCKAHYGTKCAVCGFDFHKVYGARGEGFIHVHHLTPLATIGEEYRVDPIEDLRPVCPNCHAMLHREPMMSIEELTRTVVR